MTSINPVKPHFSPLTTKNSDSCFELHKQGQFSPWSRKIFEDCLTKPYFAHSLNQDEQLLGYYIGMKVLDEVTLMDIVVSAAHRGNGLGQSLLKHLMDQCNQNNIQQIWLEVRESNAAAINIYDDAGFILVEQRENYYPSAKGKEDALIMCCYLG